MIILAKHSCTFTPKYLKTFCRRVSGCLHTRFLHYEKNAKIDCILRRQKETLENADICRKCVSLWSIHSKYIFGIGKFHEWFRYYKRPEEILALFKNDHEKFEKEVKKACAESNQFAIKRKQKSQEDQMRSKATL
ncbi:hypothetical protein RF11_11703 [Thelohanellus kitauei]|uniref:Uncharacterized protein n=1 Tax=Thelohanellus kitauei TaxID=669202 RepID=A0A0C2MZK7_THEKT|nr:hypothetical protein RF11_11703 [Thelohanellus kitauei]